MNGNLNKFKMKYSNILRVFIIYLFAIGHNCGFQAVITIYLDMQSRGQDP